MKVSVYKNSKTRENKNLGSYERWYVGYEKYLR